MTEQKTMRSSAVDLAHAQRKRVRGLSNSGYLHVFAVDDFVLLARARKLGMFPAWIPTQTGSWCGVSGEGA